ncbi:MAG: hypothetical protein IJX98_02845 [Clostridia bacterium]|nr:hypothetical protein [Clostridia bacterium]
MTMSGKIREKIIELLSDGKKHSRKEMKEFLRQSEIGQFTNGQFTGTIQALFENGTIRRIGKALYKMNNGEAAIKKCFVISPIGAEGSATRANADKLFKHIIKPVCESCGFLPIRVDQLDDANSITQTIIAYLESSDLVIADISEHNPNVFYEMGYRARTNKPMIHLKRIGEAVPFDVNTIRTFEYNLTDLDNVEKIKERLTRTIKSFDYPDPDEVAQENEQENGASASVMPVLYQILDCISEVKSEIRNINSRND